MKNRRVVSRIKNRSLLGGLVCVLGFVTPALANETDEQHPLLTSDLSLDVGIFYPDRNTSLRVNGSVDIENRRFDFDEGTGRENSDSTFAAEMGWRFSDNWSLRAQYFDSSGSTSRVLQEDIQWGDVVFGAGSSASGGTSLEVTRLFFGKHLDTLPHHELGLGLGIHWLHIGAFIQGTIIANGEPMTARRSVSSDGPLPNLGIWYRYSISPRLAFRTRLDLMSASVGEYSGLLLNASAGLSYRVTERFGIGASYNLFRLDAAVDKSDWRGNVDTRYNGLYVFVSAFF
jgi:hypothetical protein